MTVTKRKILLPYWSRGVTMCLCDPESCFVRGTLPLVRSPKTYLSQEKSQKNEQMAFLKKEIDSHMRSRLIFKHANFFFIKHLKNGNLSCSTFLDLSGSLTPTHILSIFFSAHIFLHLQMFCTSPQRFTDSRSYVGGFA